MFSVYLVGFLLIRNWRKQCFRCACDDYPGQYLMVGHEVTQTELSVPVLIMLSFRLEKQTPILMMEWIIGYISLL